MKFFLQAYNSIAIFLFFSLALIIPSGYSYGAAMLLIVALPFVFFKSTYQNLDKNTKLIVFSLIFFFITWCLEILFHEISLREFDKPIKFLAATIILLYLIKIPPKQDVIWLSIAVGGIITGIFAIWYKQKTGISRVDGFNNAIQYGNISMLIGLMSLSGAFWAWNRNSFKYLWFLLLITGFLLGLTASLLSGSRGGWIGVPLTLLYVIFHYRKFLTKKILIFLCMAFILVPSVSYFIKETGVQKRIDQGINDIKLYQQGETRTSVGTRFELWKGALILIKESPFIGWGDKQYYERVKQLVKEKRINPAIISHSHNDFLFVTSLRGGIGLISLLLLYFIPLYTFRKINKDLDIINSSLPLAGIVLSLCYIDFGLTQAFLSHNSGVIFFTMTLILIFASLKAVINE